MQILRDELFQAVKEACEKSGAKKVDWRYEETSCESLASYSTRISTQSDHFYEQFVYNIDEEAKIIYMERGWASGAQQLLLDFGNNKYHYDTYEMPEDYYNGNPAFDENYDWETWVEEHEVDKTSNEFFTILRCFDLMEEESFNGSIFGDIRVSDFVIPDAVETADGSAVPSNLEKLMQLDRGTINAVVSNYVKTMSQDFAVSDRFGLSWGNLLDEYLRAEPSHRAGMDSVMEALTGKTVEEFAGKIMSDIETAQRGDFGCGR